MSPGVIGDDACFEVSTDARKMNIIFEGGPFRVRMFGAYARPRRSGNSRKERDRRDAGLWLLLPPGLRGPSHGWRLRESLQEFGDARDLLLQ